MGRSWLAEKGTLRLAVLQAVLLVAVARPMVKLEESDYNLYHTKDGVFQAVRDIVAGCPAMMRIDEETRGDANYTSTLTVVTVEPAGLSNSHANKARLLLNFGEHGRELISSEIALHLLRLLCDEAMRRPLLTKYGISEEEVNQLLLLSVFKIVPMENVGGRERVEKGDLCERKNGRGVDPNRNWEVHWGFKEKDYDPREEYPGTAPFSEPEAMLMLDTARALHPHVWASVHSGMKALFMPYDHVATIPEGEGPAATLSILQQINQRTCKGKCAVGSGGKSVGYLAHGTATDYMYETLGVPMPMTWEVYGDTHAPFEDCFRMFNPLTRDVYNDTVESWTAAIFTLLTLLPQHPTVQGELHLPGGPGAVLVTTGGAAGGAAGRVVTGNGTQQQQQQQDGRGGRGAASSGNATGSSQASQDGDAGSGRDGSSSSADKALEVPTALKEHMQQQEDGTATEGAGQQQTLQEGEAQTGQSSMGGTTLSSAPRRSRLLSFLYWMTVLVAGLAIGNFLWSEPRVRYQLSKWLGSSRRRARGVIPL